MRKADVQRGEVYFAKISDRIARVRIGLQSPYGGWNAINLDTGRQVRIKSAAKLRRPVPWDRLSREEQAYTLKLREMYGTER